MMIENDTKYTWLLSKERWNERMYKQIHNLIVIYTAHNAATTSKIRIKTLNSITRKITWKEKRNNQKMAIAMTLNLVTDAFGN